MASSYYHKLTRKERTIQYTKRIINMTISLMITTINTTGMAAAQRQQ